MSNLKKSILVVLFILLSLLLVKLFIFSGEAETDRENDTAYYDASKRFYKIFNVKIPDKLDFCGEIVPLDKFYVYEGVDRELLVNTYWQSNSILMFKRSFRYFRLFDSILAAHQVPVDFKYLAMIESGLENNLVSPAGAAGIWQFLKSTGQEYGLSVNSEIDERYHVEKSTIAACKYLKKAKATFNSWTLAAAAYNMGSVGLSETLKLQKSDNYYDLFLNKETQRYVYRILALKIIYQSPLSYGFYLRNTDLYPEIPAYSVTIDSSVSDWAEFAVKHNSNYRELKEMNPWILKYSLTNKERKKYEVLFVQPKFRNYYDLLKNSPETDRLFNDTLKINSIR